MNWNTENNAIQWFKRMKMKHKIQDSKEEKKKK